MRKMEQKTELELKPAQQGGLVGLAVSIEELQKRYEDFKKVKKLLLDENDYYQVKGGGEAIRKTGWFTFATAFGLSNQILAEEEVIKPEEDLIRYKFTVRCIAPNGRYGDDVGSCDNKELHPDGKPKHQSAHEIRAMAKTRATERAIIFVVGASERAAEDTPDSLLEKPGETFKKATQSTEKPCSCPRDKMKLAEDNEHCSNCGGKMTQAQKNLISVK